MINIARTAVFIFASAIQDFCAPEYRLMYPAAPAKASSEPLGLTARVSWLLVPLRDVPASKHQASIDHGRHVSKGYSKIQEIQMVE